MTAPPPPFDSPRDAIAHAASTIRRGGVVAFATETVYGLGADATNPTAVARIFEIKQRPSFDPLIVHAGSLELIRACVSGWPDAASDLVDRFWPGPLTLVLPRQVDFIPDIVAAGLPTVAVRVPNHPIALALLREAGVPIAAPSANRFGSVSPTTAGHVRESLGEHVEVLDGGPCRSGVESTIISLVESSPTLLRPGATPIEDIEAVIGSITRAPEIARGLPPAPGMLARHYATRTPLHFADSAPAGLSAQRCGRLTFTLPADAEHWAALEALSPAGDLREAAAHLFAAMRRLDARGLDAIIADRFPESGLGVAINDRLRRASFSQPHRAG